jgi:peptidyl-prolyl cis-trans isomerase C
MVQIAGLGRRLALCTAVSMALSAPAFAEGETAETVVATVNGTDITLGQVIALGERLPEQYRSLPNDVLFNGVLEQLIQQTALSQTLDGKLTKRDEIILANERTAYLSGTVLQATVTEAVTDAAIQAAYDAKYGAAAPATEYHAAHILVTDEAKAKELKAQIDGGADFGDLAKANSTDGSAANGGDLGWFGLGMMVKPFEDAVVSLQPGQVSDPVQTQFGWHLVRLIETREAAKPTIEEVRAELAAEIESAAISKKVEDVTAAATITRTEGIDPALLQDQTLLDN